MPKFDKANVDNSPDPILSDEKPPSASERRRIQMESREAGARPGSTTSKNAPTRVSVIAYTPPEEERTTPMKIRAGDLVVDPRYNREIDHKWVQDIASSFNPDQLQVLNVSRRLFRNRPDGTEEQVYDGNVEAADRVEYVILSGQHRLLATLMAKGENFLLTCNVYDQLTESQEAELFALFDEMVKPHQQYQKHRAHVFGKNPMSLEVDKIATDTGLVVYDGKQGAHRDGVVYAVGTLYSIYRRSGPDFLRRLLEIHYMAWQDNQHGLTAPMLQGTAVLMRRFARYSQWRDEWLAEALSDPARNPLTLRQRAQGSAMGQSGTTISQEVARLEHAYYQAGRKGYQRLPPWNATSREIDALSEAANARSKAVAGRRGGRGEQA